MYIEELLQKTLYLTIKPVDLKWGVFEQVKRDDVMITVGCVHINAEVKGCREYINQRTVKEELRMEERRGYNPFIERKHRDGVFSVR